MVMLITGTSLAESSTTLTLSPTPSARNHTEIGTITLEPDIQTRSLGPVSLYSGNFLESNEETLEDVVEKEARENGEKFSITIAVQQPNPGTYDCAVYGYTGKIPHVSGVDIGHTYVLLGNHIPDETVFYARGFYPSSGLSHSAVLNNTSVKGRIFDDAGHAYTVRRTYWVDMETFNKAVVHIQNTRTACENGTVKYNLVDFNCTTYAKELMEVAGINSTGIINHQWQIPQSIKDKFWYYSKEISKLEANVGCYPGAAGEQLKASMEKQ